MSRFRTIAAGFAVAAAALLLTATPASAHDQLVSTDPKAGSTLEKAPEKVTMMFSADILDTGALAKVVDASDTDWVQSVETDGPELIVTVKPNMPSGEYTVKWRVVSSDGHPISNMFAFSVAGDTPGSQTTPPTTAATSAPVANPDTTAATTPPKTDAVSTKVGGDSSSTNVVLIIVTVAIAAIVIFFVVLLLVRNRRKKPAVTSDADDNK